MREAANKLDDRQSSTANSSVKCVWMVAGVVDYKLCDRDFDCDRCPFDQAFRDQSRAHAFKSNQRFNTGEGLGLTDLQGYEVAPMLFYHPAHVWARIEDKGVVRVGLDDFGQKLAGRIYSVQAPRAGTTVRRGEPCWRVSHHAGEAALASPVAGTIQIVNSNLAQHPSLINRDPYGEGWAFTIQPSGLEPCLAELYYGRKVELWYESDIDRLYQAMNGLLLGSATAVGATMQDGGSRVTDFTSLLTADQMRHVIDSFLSAAVGGAVAPATDQGR